MVDLNISRECSKYKIAVYNTKDIKYYWKFLVRYGINEFKISWCLRFNVQLWPDRRRRGSGQRLRIIRRRRRRHWGTGTDLCGTRAAARRQMSPRRRRQRPASCNIAVCPPTPSSTCISSMSPPPPPQPLNPASMPAHSRTASVRASCRKPGSRLWSHSITLSRPDPTRPAWRWSKTWSQTWSTTSCASLDGLKLAWSWSKASRARCEPVCCL